MVLVVSPELVKFTGPFHCQVPAIVPPLESWTLVLPPKPMWEPLTALSVPALMEMLVTGLVQPNPVPSPLAIKSVAPGCTPSVPRIWLLPAVPPLSSSVPPVTVVPPV